MKVGDKVKLTGVTRHGKNRVREQGDLWTVTAMTPASQSSFAAVGTEIALLRAESNPDKNWRWVEVAHDKNFHVRTMSNDIEELKSIKSENK
jgi:hypothetical protein